MLVFDSHISLLIDCLHYIFIVIMKIFVPNESVCLTAFFSKEDVHTA